MTTFRRLNRFDRSDFDHLIIGCTCCGDNILMSQAWVSSDDNHIVCPDCVPIEDEDPMPRDTTEEDNLAAFNDRLDNLRNER